MTKEQLEKLEKFAEYIKEYDDLCEANKNIELLKQNMEKDSQFYKLNLSQNDLKETILKKANEIETKLYLLRHSLKDLIKNEAKAEEKQNKKILKKKMCRLALKFIPTGTLAIAPVVALTAIGGVVSNAIASGSAPIGILSGAIAGSIISGISIGCETDPPAQNKFVKILAAPAKPFVKNFIEISSCKEEIKYLDYDILTRIANEKLPQNKTVPQNENSK